MNKKIMLIGSLVLILAMGLVFSGCKTEESEDLGDRFDGTGGPSSYTFGHGSDGVTKHNVYVITWDAAEDANGYTIVFQPTGKKTIETVETGGIVYGTDKDNNDNDYAPNNTKYYIVKDTANWFDTDTSLTANPDPDKWSAVVILDAFNLKDSLKGKLGLVTLPLTKNDKNNTVVWSEEIEVSRVVP